MSDYEFNSIPAGAIGRYSLLKDAYYGTGGFANGWYLDRHERESKEAYAERCHGAYYLNYFAPIVNALIDPVFKRRPLRDFKGPAEDFITEFSKDVDRAGSDIHSFMKQVALHAKMYGVAFIVMDNRQMSEDTSGTRQDMMRNKDYPYVYCLDPEYVDSFGLDNTGAITYIRFHEISSIEDGAVKYRYVEFDREGWRVLDESGGATSGAYTLGRVPVIPLYSRLLEGKTILPAPELMPVAMTARAIYNHCSWLSEILKNETFPILTIPSMDQKDIVVGTNNAMGYDPMASHEPAFIAPPSDPATVLQSQIKSLVQEMYRMASLSFMTGTGDNSNKSGLARQWEFERTNQQLANFASQCAKAENEMMQLFCQWIGSSIDYHVSYPDDFGVVDVADELTQAQAVLDLGLTNGLKEEVLKKVIAAYCPNITDERFDELLDEMREEGNDRIYGEEPSEGNEPV